MEKAKKGKPFGFYVCALGFTFERLAFYTVKYLLAIGSQQKLHQAVLDYPTSKVLLCLVLS